MTEIHRLCLGSSLPGDVQVWRASLDTPGLQFDLLARTLSPDEHRSAD